MRSTCAPFCDPGRVDVAKRDALIANISLGVGAAALVTAGALVFVLQPTSTSPSKSTAATFATPLRVNLGPAGVKLGGVF